MTTEDGRLSQRALTLADAAEHLRQKRESFDQQKKHDALHFYLKFAMGCVAVVMFPAIFFVCTEILFNYEEFEPAIVSSAAGAFFVDVVGLVVTVWKVVISSEAPQPIRPLDRDVSN